MMMNGTTLDREQSAPTPPRGDAVRVYRGRSMRELVSQIRADLGPDAIVLRSREGRTGGVAGFFAQRFVEVEATAGGHVDIYDEGPAEFAPALDLASERAVGEDYDAHAVPPAAPEASATPPTDEGPLQAPEVEPTVALGAGAETATSTFSALLERVETAADGAVDEVGFARVAPAVTGERAAVGPGGFVGVGLESAVDGVGVVESLGLGGGGLVCEALVARGCSERLARWLVVGARTHGLPFVVAGDLAVAVREEVVRALPRFAGLPSGGAVVAVVGAGGVGKTRVAAALAVAYGGGSALAARAIAVGGAREGSSLVGLLAGRGVPVTVGEEFGGRERRGGEFVVVDTPALSPADGDGIALLGERLAVLECDGVLVAMPASVGLGAARQMLAAFAPLGVSGIVLAHVDETDQQGVAIELSIGTGVPLAYLHGGSDSRGALRAANPEHLAHELLP